VILANPRYTGRQVWNKQRKDGVLIDVEDVALGHTTKMRGNEPGNWIWSGRSVHVPLINAEIFERAQAVRRARGTADERSPRRTPRAVRPSRHCHPPAVYLREEQLLPHLDDWLSRKFSPDPLPQTIRELEAAQAG
jgi:site-specific DNA recombinase